ncbi:hypothetical protein N7532_001869 [Penicillium argentinense]|uniref:Uncharacterized protein n=1 Tax=Penicillium argentinense TaxID=1131581 RepID=A0A9W9G3C9_9EURO|nr:uncharacterized protein N7532_001869 [Penicillium argentinense]KAJ5111334.1 hypothetical protein N7532_001869 [Penicillium argentinense]
MFSTRRPWSLLGVLAIFFCATSCLAASDSRKCYNPDSSQATADVPCTDDDVTFCCNKGDICMSNGLCYLQQSSGFALSRASCTDLSWSSCGSYKYCYDYNKNSGFPIVAANFAGNKTVHCCGTATYDNGTVSCPMSSVSVPVGTVIPGRAALAVSSTSNSTNSSCPDSSSGSSSSSSSSSRETAIGAGVGVPLGVIAIASLAWAFWERRGRVRALAQAQSAQSVSVYPDTAQPQQQMAYYSRPAELGAPSAELGGSEAATELSHEAGPKPSGHLLS